jgi:hypothetical protein
MIIIKFMRNIYQTNKQELGQFMTPPPIARLLVSKLPLGGSNLLELGAGEGSLIQEAVERLGDIEITAIERDKYLAKRLRQFAPYAKIVAGDVLSKNSQRIIATNGPFDYTVGNPPYAIASTQQLDLSALNFWKLYQPRKGNRLDAQFLAQSLSSLKSTGSAAFILPLAFFSDEVYIGFREALIQRFSFIRIIELPLNAFVNAEVATVVCHLNGLRTRRCRVELASADLNGDIVESMSIPAKVASIRMDYSFHRGMAQLREHVGINPMRLADLGAEIVRGSTTAAELIRSEKDFLHTTHLPATGIGRFKYLKKTDSSYRVAKVGDIVVPRVGSRCLLRQAIVVQGEIPFTDCVYRVRIPKQNRESVLHSLASPVGEIWRRLHAHGSCAKHITVKDLFTMPIA